MGGRRTAIAFCVILCLCLGACSEADTEVHEPTPEPKRTVVDRSERPITGADLQVFIAGETFSIGEPALEIIESLGSSHEKRERRDGGGALQSTMYFYDALTITTVPIDGKERLHEVVFTNDSFETRRGIRVGDTVEDVQKAYGAGVVDENWIIYTLPGKTPGPENEQLFFVLDDSQYVLLIGYQKAMAAG